MKRYLLKLTFDGGAYCGWQVQRNGVTVQEKLQDALEEVLGRRPGVTGCSRTDSGVHAKEYFCHFDAEAGIPAGRWPLALNAKLPADIAAVRCFEVDGGFHARYSCVAKRYRYIFRDAPGRDPFARNYAFQSPVALDAELMIREAASFVGTHDFSAFAASGGSARDTVRRVYSAGVERRGGFAEFWVTADGFLYNMARIMAGTLYDIAAGRLPPGGAAASIEGCERNLAGRTMPPHGLYLERVYYLDIEGQEPDFIS